MIDPLSLHRLVLNITAAVRPADDVDASTAEHREALIDFAGRHDLDLEDTATLYAVAAGQAIDLGPVRPTEI